MLITSVICVTRLRTLEFSLKETASESDVNRRFIHSMFHTMSFIR